MPQPLSKQILTLSLPHNSWEPGKHQPASSTPVKQGSSIHVLKRELSYQNCKLFAHSTLSGSTKNCALILQETSSSDPSPLLVAEDTSSFPQAEGSPSMPGRMSRRWGMRALSWALLHSRVLVTEGHNAATASFAQAGLKELSTVLPPVYFTDDGVVLAKKWRGLLTVHLGEVNSSSSQ